jgi:hypothetical protein
VQYLCDGSSGSNASFLCQTQQLAARGAWSAGRLLAWGSRRQGDKFELIIECLPLLRVGTAQGS